MMRGEIAQRLFDVLVASAAGLALAPAIAAAALLVRCLGPGPLLVGRERVGRGFRRFRLLEFRTGPTGSPDDPLGLEPPAHPIGRLLRATRLDRLPRLWNVLAGDLSLVGPRPEPERFVREFREDYRALLAVRPGLVDPAGRGTPDPARLGAGADPEDHYRRLVLPERLRRSRAALASRSIAGDLGVLAAAAAGLLLPLHLTAATAPRALLVGSGPGLDGARRRLAGGPAAAIAQAAAIDVAGGPAAAEAWIAGHAPDLVVVDEATTPPAARRAVAAACTRSGTRWITRSRLERRGTAGTASVDLELLLDRDLVEAAVPAPSTAWSGRRVLVLGAEGLGAELAARLAAAGPESLALADRDPAALDRLARRLRARHPGLEVETHLLDLDDPAGLAAAMRASRPAWVFHAAWVCGAALLERHPAEALRWNLEGPRLAARAAAAAGAEAFVLASMAGDAAPGGSADLAARGIERAFHDAAADGGLRRVVVRVPTLAESREGPIARLVDALERGERPAISHPEATRRVLATGEAAALVLHAAAIGRSGEVLALDAGRPLRLLDVAERLLRAAGFLPGRDADVAFEGLPPGETLVEAALDERESAWRTEHPRILALSPRGGRPSAPEPADAPPALLEPAPAAPAAAPREPVGLGAAGREV